MGSVADHPYSEPFGQTGVRRYFRPLLLFLCALAVSICGLLLVRSHNNYDRFERVANGRHIMIASALDRFIIDITPLRGQMPDPSPWTFSTTPIEALSDGWAPSWRKTLGVEWGPEVRWRRGQFPEEYWRLRIRWRTLMAVYLTPLLWEVVRRRLTRREAPTPATAVS